MLYDKDIRETLFEFLELRYGKVRIIEEKTMGRSRADVVMDLENEVIGVEIKSDADTYARLKRQVRDYNQFFDRNYVVVGTSHAMHIEEHVPNWWGIITVELENDAADFYVLRTAKENPKLDWSRKMHLLWRPELAHIQAKNEMPRYPQKSKDFVIEKILQCVPLDILRMQVSEELFERDYLEGIREIEEYKKEHAGKPRKKAVGRKRKRKNK